MGKKARLALRKDKRENCCGVFDWVRNGINQNSPRMVERQRERERVVCVCVCLLSDREYGYISLSLSSRAFQVLGLFCLSLPSYLPISSIALRFSIFYLFFIYLGNGIFYLIIFIFSYKNVYVYIVLKFRRYISLFY